MIDDTFDDDYIAHLFVVAANHSADAVMTLAAGLRAATDPAHWQRMEPDFILPSLSAPGRQQRRKRAWSMRNDR